LNYSLAHAVIRRKRKTMKPMDFKKATLQQLSTIIRFEECVLPYKCAAESEIHRRSEESGLPVTYEV
jgi:hypothetical protein